MLDLVWGRAGRQPTRQWRPMLHITAEDTWINDPNGLVYHEGTYHVFFQNNPRGRTWGHMSWGHATSTDLVTWHAQPVALACTAEEEAWSGSAVADVGNTAGFSPDGRTALVAIYTAAYTKASRRAGTQAQALAYSTDGGTTWTRYEGNPVLDIGSRDFRDPKVFWFGGHKPEGAGGHWVMVVAEPPRHRVAIYTSPDLKAWTRRSQFGPASGGLWQWVLDWWDGSWECPDLFPLADPDGRTRWVLVVSVNRGVAGGSGTRYLIGGFDGAMFTPSAEEARSSTTSDCDAPTWEWFDFGHDQYAAVSFNEAPGGRRLMVGWANNWAYANRVPTYPWRGALSLVREVRLERTAAGSLRLAQRPVLPDPVPDGVVVHDLQVSESMRARHATQTHARMYRYAYVCVYM
jgi:fructan beta-fructosidase